MFPKCKPEADQCFFFPADGIFEEQSTLNDVWGAVAAGQTDRDGQTDEADTRTTALRFLYQSNQHL